MRNISGSLFALAARALAQAYHSPDITLLYARGVRIGIDVTVNATSAAIVPTIEVKDPVSGVYTTVLTGAAITGVGHTELVVYPGATVAANTIVAQPMGRVFRLTLTHGNTNSATYSASYTGLV